MMIYFVIITLLQQLIPSQTTISIIKMLTISKNLLWPRDLESFKGGNFNTLSLVDWKKKKKKKKKKFIRQFGSVFNKKMVKSVIYLLFSYQTGYIMWHITKQRVCETISIIKMLTISKNLVWPRVLESFKVGNFNTL
jgi:hypothetical protein